jgi:phosphoribosylanthranilate isomerase
MWVKICGMTAPEAVEAALAAGVQALGFVLAASPRRVTPALAARLAQPARGRVACVAVTRHPSQEEIEEILAVLEPDILQSDAEDLASLRLPAQLGLMPVLRAAPPVDAKLPPRLLFEGPRSGVGVRCDWGAARALAGATQLVLAGGLDAANVGDAIAQVLPYGVDVSSGVEERPGVKSPAAIARFVAAARDAFARFES